MSAHDDYSSDEESLNEAKLTNVHLGFIDIPFDELKDENGTIPADEMPTIEDTFIGGQPIWLHPSSIPDEKLLTCENCGKKMALYLQAFAPLEDKLYDRVIYIFGCKNTQVCSKKKGTIKCIRGVIKDPVKMAEVKRQQDEALQKQMDQKLKLEAKNKLQDELTKDLFKKDSKASSNPFGGDSNPFGGSSNPFSSESNPFSSGSGKKEETKETKEAKEAKDKPSDSKETKQQEQETYASIAKTNAPSNTKPRKPVTQLQLPEYPGYFLYVSKEKFKANVVDPEVEKYKHLIETQSIDDGEGSSKGQSSNSSSIANDPQLSKLASMLEDKVFENFSTTVLHNTGQILRYDLGGKPLLYNGKDDIFKHFKSTPFNIPKPGYNPSSNRQFELQMMPKAIIDLENDENANINAILNGMAWGTIIVCSDIEDYIPEEYFDDNNVAYVEEYCGVQWEESV